MHTSPYRQRRKASHKPFGVLPSTVPQNGHNVSVRTAVHAEYSRAIAARLLGGQTYGGLRDMWRILGYPDVLRTEDYFSKFRRGDIASTLLSLFPEKTWQDTIKIVERAEDTERTPWDESVRQVFKLFNIWSVLTRVDTMAGMGEDGWAVIFIGSDDIEPDDPNGFSKELTTGKLTHLTAFSQLTATVQSNQKTKNNVRFGLPDFYTIKGLESITKIHYSRVFHIVVNQFDSRWKGLPVLEKVWNRLLALDKIVDGGAEAAWKNRGLNVFDVASNGEQGEVEDGDFESFSDQIDNINHGVKDYLLTQDVKSSRLSSSRQSFKSDVDAIVELLAGAFRIPKSEIQGSERGELANNEDKTNLAKTVRDRQVNFASPILRMVIDQFMSMGVLKTVGNYDVVVPELESSTEGEKAAIIAVYTGANESQVKADGTIVISGDELRSRVLDIEPLDESEQPQTDDGVRTAADLANGDNTEPDWKVVHRVADAHIDPLAEIIDNVFANAGADITDLDTAESIAGDAIDDALLELMPDELLDIINDTGQGALASAQARGTYYFTPTSRSAGEPILYNSTVISATANEQVSPADFQLRTAQFDLIFDVENPTSVQFALDRSSALVTEIGDDTRNAIQLLIAEGQARSISAAQLVKNVRAAVGIRTDQVDALYGFLDRLNIAEPGSQVFMGIERGREIFVTVPRSGVSNSFRQRMHNKFAAQLRTQRARLIARSETLRSANQGLVEMWGQAQRVGDLPLVLNRVWIATGDDRTRETHAGWDGSITLVGQPFDFGVEPGEEPNCRCSQGLVN